MYVHNHGGEQPKKPVICTGKITRSPLKASHSNAVRSRIGGCTFPCLRGWKSLTNQKRWCHSARRNWVTKKSWLGPASFEAKKR